MDQANLETAAASAPHARQERGLLAFVSLAYVWLLGSVLVSALVVLWVAATLWAGRVPGVLTWLLALVAVALLVSGCHTLWRGRQAPPRGQRLTPAEAPQLFDALARLREKVQGPAIDEVYIDEDFNASISRVPRWGGFGGHINRLVIGLPMLMAMDRQRILAVLAHEYGHLRGGPGGWAGKVYHARRGWSGFHTRLTRNPSMLAQPSIWFFRWYAPRLEHSTLALARQDEFEADAIAARILGKPVLATALVEFSIKSQWLQNEFWPAHWRRTLTRAEPDPPMARLRDAALQPVSSSIAYRSLQTEWNKQSAAGDSHPVLRERVLALLPRAQPVLPRWSETAAVDLLGPALEQVMQTLDARWCRAQRENWQRRHAKAAVMLARVQSLRARRNRLQAEEWLEWGQLLEVILPVGRVQSLFNTALAQRPSDADACQALAAVLVESFMQRVDESLSQGNGVLIEQAPEWPMIWPLLQQLWLDSLHYRWWAARMAVHIWQTLHDEAGREEVQVQVLTSGEAWQASREPPTVTQLQSLETGSPDLRSAAAAHAVWTNRWADWVNWSLRDNQLGQGGQRHQQAQVGPPAGVEIPELLDILPHVEFERLYVAEELALWQQREKVANESETRSWRELQQLGSNLRQASAASLRASAQHMLRVVLATYPQVQRAWLVRQNLQQMSDRPVHLLLVQFSGVDAAQIQQLCESIRTQWPGPGLGFCLPMQDPAKARAAHQIAQTMLYERGMDFTPYMLALCGHARLAEKIG